MSENTIEHVAIVVAKMDEKVGHLLATQTEFKHDVKSLNHRVSRVSKELILLRATEYNNLLNRVISLEDNTKNTKSKFDKIFEACWKVFVTIVIAYSTTKLGLTQ